MKRNQEITAEQILTARQAAICPEMPADADDMWSSSGAQVLEAFRERFAKACDAGIWKRLSRPYRAVAYGRKPSFSEL
jgi:hypothetical protein